jgi:NAD(P)-dependent dehydrogenase (short-subunit alcohol dehydrogenase family)
VKEFLKQGAKVAIASRTAYDLGDLPEPLRLNAIAVAVDVSKNDDITRLFDKPVEAFVKVDVVVANAGISTFAPLEQITEDDFRRIFDVNVKGMFFTVQKVLPHLNSGASIILATSLGGHVGTPGGTMYNASKAAGRSLARTLAADLAGKLADYAARKRVPQALVVEAALASHFSPDGTDRLEAALARRLDRMSRPMERVERHVAISNEALALFVRFWLTSTPPLPDTAQLAAQAKGR